ncbi:hypothetical protein [Tenacibaculum ovolyticum]|uniref:hypothetical protein n=1 Tax=Tenacibaculum ovolyticum TaxID=104270 RepID=UPI001F2292F7|nr:hypothetical protein [Tenacibaculum ovolyticum]
MKKTLLLILLLINSISFSQISVSSSHVGKAEKIKEEDFNRFKKSKTIFILSNVLDKSEYEKILKNSWTVTPYQIVNIDIFRYSNYLTNNYSFVELNTINKNITRASSISNPTNGISPMMSASYLYLNLDVFMLENKTILKKLDKIKNKKPEKKYKNTKEIFHENRINLSRVYLFLNSNSARNILLENSEIQKIVAKKTTTYSEKENNIFSKILYTKDIFRNYKPGFLKNYFQKINTQLTKNEKYWLYGSDHTNEIKELKNKTLYIPKYLDIKFHPFKGTESSEGDERIKKLLEKYQHKYEVIKANDISEKIMNNEEFYYLRYVRMNTDRFIQIVNSKNGEIIYREYIHGMSYNLKSKNFKKLNKTIFKALKK